MTNKTEEARLTPAYWLARLATKDDNIDGYENHAEVIAKYIIEAYRTNPELVILNNRRTYLTDNDGQTQYSIVLVDSLYDALKKVYGPEHPCSLALAEATGFSWGWAYNTARYALELPLRPNPAIISIPGPTKEK